MGCSCLSPSAHTEGLQPPRPSMILECGAQNWLREGSILLWGERQGSPWGMALTPLTPLLARGSAGVMGLPGAAASSMQHCIGPGRGKMSRGYVCLKACVLERFGHLQWTDLKEEKTRRGSHRQRVKHPPGYKRLPLRSEPQPWCGRQMLRLLSQAPW